MLMLDVGDEIYLSNHISPMIVLHLSLDVTKNIIPYEFWIVKVHSSFLLVKSFMQPKKLLTRLALRDNMLNFMHIFAYRIKVANLAPDMVKAAEPQGIGLVIKAQRMMCGLDTLHEFELYRMHKFDNLSRVG